MFVDFQTPPPHWTLSNDRMTSYAFTLTPFLPLRVNVLYECSQKELISKIYNPISYIQRDTTYNILIYSGVYFYKSGIFQGYFTWPCTDICLKGNNLRKWFVSICFYFLYTDQLWRVEEKCDMKKYSLFCVTFLTVDVK